MSGLMRGALVPDRFAGNVASIHDAAVNIIVRDRRGAYFVSLTRDRRDWTELSIAVPTATWLAITATIRRETRALPIRLSADSALVVGNAGRSFPVDHGPPPRHLSPASRPSATTISEAQIRLLTEHGGTGFVALLADRGSFERGSRPGDDPFALRAAMILRDGSAVSSLAVARLVGLGTGFTPSGDDFVSGVLAAELLLDTELVDRDEVERALPKTTAGGVSLLRVALAGYPPAYQMHIIDEMIH